MQIPKAIFKGRKPHVLRRFKEGDLYSHEPSKLLKDLSKQEINHLTHSLGVEIQATFKGEFYRDYSVYYHNNKEFDKMIELGLFKHLPKV